MRKNHEKLAKYEKVLLNITLKVPMVQIQKNSLNKKKNRNLLLEYVAFTKFLRLWHIIFTKLETANYIRKIRKICNSHLPFSHTHISEFAFRTRCFHEIFEIFAQVSSNSTHYFYESLGGNYQLQTNIRKICKNHLP